MPNSVPNRSTFDSLLLRATRREPCAVRAPKLEGGSPKHPVALREISADLVRNYGPRRLPRRRSRPKARRRASRPSGPRQCGSEPCQTGGPSRAPALHRILIGVTGGIAASRVPSRPPAERRRLRVRCAVQDPRAPSPRRSRSKWYSGSRGLRRGVPAPNGTVKSANRGRPEMGRPYVGRDSDPNTLPAGLGTADNFLLTTALAFRGQFRLRRRCTAPVGQPARRARASPSSRARSGADRAGVARASGESVSEHGRVPEIVAAVKRRLSPGTIAGGKWWSPPTDLQPSTRCALSHRSGGPMGFASPPKRRCAARRSSSSRGGLAASGEVARTTCRRISRGERGARHAGDADSCLAARGRLPPEARARRS